MNINQSEKAYHHLKREILGRYIKHGSRVKEVFWANKIGVNRGDIRQALARLLADGIVIKGPKRGFFVRQYTDEDLTEIYETRFILEKGAAELAIERITEEDIRELDEICKHMDTMAQHGYEQGFDEADLRFHSRLVQAAHNKKLFQIYDKANILLSGMNARMTSNTIIVELKRTAEEHHIIVNALKNKDITTVLKLLRKGF